MAFNKEFLRRFLSLVLIISGGFFIFHPGSDLLVVSAADFEKSYKKANRFSGSDAFTPADLTEYINKTTRDRTVEVDGSQWMNLAKAIANADSDNAMRKRRSGDRFIYKPSEEPFSSLDAVRNFQYIRVNDGEAWLTLSKQHPLEIYGLPDDFSYPLRSAGFLLMLAGMAFYVFPPRHKFSPEDIHYPAGAAVILPDVIGLFLTTFFILAPYVIVSHSSPDSSMFSIETGWIWLTASMWLMGGISVFLLAVGARYCDLSYRTPKEGLQIVKGRKINLIGWEEITGYEFYEKNTSKILGRLLILFGGSFQSAGLGVAMLKNNEFGVKINSSNRKPIYIMANYLRGYDLIVEELSSRGIENTAK